jgi:hypothetical protein
MEPTPELQAGAESEPKPNGNMALTLVVFSWCAWMVFQTVQLVRERNHLTQLHSSQESALQDAAKVKAQIDAIASDTARLAAEGNPGARRIIAELKRRGFNVGAEPTAPAK